MIEQAWRVIPILGLLALTPCLLAAETVLSYPDIVARTWDLQHLAVLPQPGEVAGQWSSYDRSSQYDESTGSYVDWAANRDGDGFIREENGLQVLAEMEGPGCIWRIWSALPQEGRVRIYIDGAEAPAVDLPFIEYFDHSQPAFDFPALVHVAALGYNSHVPIPYQESCRIVAEPGWGSYYMFTYGSFPPGTRVPSFTMDLAAEDLAALKEADRMFAAAGEKPYRDLPDERTIRRRVRVAPGRERDIARVDGARAITGIRIKLSGLPEAPLDRIALRELAVAAYWDGSEEPAVWTPFNDFFGTAAGPNAYLSLPTGLTEEGWWYAYWYMPFADGARLTLINDGDGPVRAECEVEHAALTTDIDRLGRFHCKWHRNMFLPPEPERWIDWTMLFTEGRGRYCGVMLHVWNPKGDWWGEGDEKFHVDGEPFPSIFGTGSEDYFGYAWCSPDLFHHAVHNQTISQQNVGHISVNRWHIADNVPFQERFEGYIEKYFPDDRPTRYAATAYWYLEPGGNDPYGPVSRSDRVDYTDLTWAGPQATRVPGVLEGESLKVLSRTGGVVRPQDMGNFPGTWSGAEQLWLTHAEPGDRFAVEVEAPRTGRYRIDMAFTSAPDYGVVQCYINGERLRGPIDFYHPNTVVPFGPFDMGTVRLEAGSHELTFEVVGANPAATPAYMFGLDYVRLVFVGDRAQD